MKLDFHLMMVAVVVFEKELNDLLLLVLEYS